MSILLVVIHVVVCVALIMIVLLQTGKGADMGAAFGGGSSQTLFGSSGASTFLSKATTVAAIVFMLTSLTLAYVAGGKTVKSVVSDIPVPAAEQQQTQEPQTEGNAADTGAPAETPETDAGTKTE
ncbi:SecG: preprotein translocase, subunit [Desulfosarcina variabilis str. Montpellier]|uniref:preprotein translocase subunit SecG n=1 Tax=Desulfosarcina variabilis TaxID=2300 RepID=UPI003AFB386E